MASKLSENVKRTIFEGLTTSDVLALAASSKEMNADMQPIIDSYKENAAEFKKLMDTISEDIYVGYFSQYTVHEHGEMVTYEDDPDGEKIPLSIGLCVNFEIEKDGKKYKKVAFYSLVESMLTICPLNKKPEVNKVTHNHTQKLKVTSSFLKLVILYVAQNIQFLIQNDRVWYLTGDDENDLEQIKAKLYNAEEEIRKFNTAPEIPEGGGKKGYIKSTRKFRCSDGVERVLYKKGTNMYVKKKSSKTGKMTFSKVKVA